MHTNGPGAADIAFEADDWSLKAVSASDPRFWLRVEKPEPGTAAIVVTDAMPGRQDEAVLASALAQILSHWELRGIGRIVFADILPGCGDGGQEAERARETASFLARVLRRALAKAGLQPDASELVERQGKLDCVFRVGGASPR